MKYLYEFIGTFFLVFTVGMTLFNSSATLAPLAIGAVLAALVFAGGYVCSAHYNPAISLAAFLTCKLSLSDLLRYIIVQVVAAFVASYLVLYLRGFSGTAVGYDLLSIFIAEFLFTFALCFVALNVAASKSTAGNSYFGLAIGLIVFVGVYIIGDISGGALNPAVAIGITVLGVNFWSNIWVYIIASIASAALAAAIFNCVTRCIGKRKVA